MAADMKKARLEVVKDKKPKNFGKHYDRIKTAAPSSEAKKGEHFQEYAFVVTKVIVRGQSACFESCRFLKIKNALRDFQQGVFL